MTTSEDRSITDNSLQTSKDKAKKVWLPVTVDQVITDIDDQLVHSDLSMYVPIPTGFDPLDDLIGGGLYKTDLILLGGAQGVGKTIALMQMARNITLRPNQYALCLSYEHTPTHLLNRLICLETINPPDVDLSHGCKLKDLYDIIIAERAKSIFQEEDGGGNFLQIVRKSEKTARAWERCEQYGNRLVLARSSQVQTNLKAIDQMVSRLCETIQGNVTVFIDYLQKISIYPERARDEEEQVSIITHGLKTIALTYEVPIVAIVAAEREGLRTQRLHLLHHRGGSALDYEADVALVLNNKYSILNKDVADFNPYMARQYRDWVVMSLEKNRHGPSMQHMEFQLHAPYFAFNPRGQMVNQPLIDGDNSSDGDTSTTAGNL